jgi:8-oxo-dGTP pyrophosphatase MutT (NUDIX family)
MFRGRIVSLDVADVELPNGRPATVEIVRHPGGAAAVALDADHRVCLLRQYRPVFDQWLWELPAGKLDPGEGPESTAQRELAEEAGLKAAHWESLGEAIPSPGVFGEVLHLYLARDLSPTAAAPEEHELFEVHWLAFDTALARAAAGEIVDAKTVIGLFRAHSRLARAI